jgi:hypothetical protein
MAMIDFAKMELDAIGMKEDSTDEMNLAMRKHILHMIEEFSKEGHSGFSASYAVNILAKLLVYKPLSPLQGTDDEWMEVYMDKGVSVFQNKRCSHVFRENGQAYDSEGKIFWEWNQDGTTKSYFTRRESRINITFPYTPTRVYEEVVNQTN